MKELFEILPQVGAVEWIGLREEKRGKISSSFNCVVTVEHGLKGDHYQGKSRKRQVTLIQAEHIAVVASILKKEVDPIFLRRNLVISGINLLALKEKKFRIGDDVILEFTGLCHPCSRMETNLGSGGYNAMRGHGGITASVIQGGAIKRGDKVYYKNKNKI